MSEKSTATFSAALIEEAAEAARMRGVGKFSLKDVVKILGARSSKALNERISRILDTDISLFCDGLENYFGRAEFFAGREFLVTPSDFEIDENILVPGHRFCPFVSPDVFPSEVVLTAGDEVISSRDMQGQLSDLFAYHMLMGSDQVFDFLIAENPANAHLAHKGGKEQRKIHLTVFEMGDFYKKHDFSGGDALLCQVSDWQTGKIAVQYLSGAERNAATVRQWCADFAVCLDEVIDRFDNFFDLPEQLSWSFFLGGDKLSDGRKAASLDEFIRADKSVEIAFEAGHASFVRRIAPENTEDTDFSVPEGVEVSKGETSSLEGMLKELGIALNPTEIDSYILDCCYARELDYEGFYNRCFGGFSTEFADEAQEAFFANYVEDRWEEITGNYNRVDDEVKAPVRTQILELIDRRSEFLQLESAGEMPEDAMRRLAEIFIYLDEMLRLLNSPEHNLEQAEADEMMETIGSIDDTIDSILNKMGE